MLQWLHIMLTRATGWAIAHPVNMLAKALTSFVCFLRLDYTFLVHFKRLVRWIDTEDIYFSAHAKTNWTSFSWLWKGMMDVSRER